MSAFRDMVNEKVKEADLYKLNNTDERIANMRQQVQSITTNLYNNIENTETKTENKEEIRKL